MTFMRCTSLMLCCQVLSFTSGVSLFIQEKGNVVQTCQKRGKIVPRDRNRRTKKTIWGFGLKDRETSGLEWVSVGWVYKSTLFLYIVESIKDSTGNMVYKYLTPGFWTIGVNQNTWRTPPGGCCGPLLIWVSDPCCEVFAHFCQSVYLFFYIFQANFENHNFILNNTEL